MAGQGLSLGDRAMAQVVQTVLVLSRAAPPFASSCGPVGNEMAGARLRIEFSIVFRTPTMVASPAVMAPTTLAGPATRGNSRAAV